jgi:excisionase family DNA binding protein
MAQELKRSLTVRAAARRLGVHPNTLRNWEQRGVIHLTRLPGSHYRRVPIEEVQRLAQEMEGKPREQGGVWLQLPPTDPLVIAEGRALAHEIQEQLAQLEDAGTLEDTMRTLRGHSWSS